MYKQLIINQLEKYLNEIASHSKCISRKVGAVIVVNDKIIEGYNGAPTGCTTCKTCLRRELNVPSGTRHELCRGLHAEQMAINKAAKDGISIDGSILYCTTYPCSMCAKSIISSGIREVYYIDDYPDNLAKQLFSESNVTVQKITAINK